MTASLAQSVSEAHPLQVGRRWVSAYRATWCLLTLAAVGLLAASLLHPAAHSAILTLRLVKSAVLISVSAILVRRRANDPVAALLSLAFVTWTISSGFDFASMQMLPMLLDRLRFLLFVLALLLFPDGRWRPAWTRRVAAASAGVFVLGLAEGAGIAPTRMFLPLAIACVAAAVVALFMRFRTAQSEAVRQQLKWVALGLVAGIGMILGARAGAAIEAASPAFRPMPILWEGMFQLGIVVTALGFLVSLLRYRLFDAETAISRSAAFAALTVAIVAIFAGTEATIENLGQAYLGMGIGNISAAMAAAVAAVLLNPLHDRISNWAERRFQRDLVLLKREVPELLEDLAGSSSSRELGAAVLPRICQAVHATRAALLVNGTIVAVDGIDRRAARRSARGLLGSDLFPLRLAMNRPTSTTRGWLLLGPRPDGSLYGPDDLNAINQILPALHRSLTASTAKEALALRNRRASRSLARKVEHLQERLLAIETEARAAH